MKEQKVPKKQKFHTFFFSVAWSIEMKYKIIFMYDTYTYRMYNYDIKYNLEFFI